MIGGVNFQPGVQDKDSMGSRPPGSNQGVQEAIKVLSLRLPKVVGAQAVAPNALLQSQGSRGNPNIDSIVESVLQKFFPNARGGQTQAQAPMVPTMQAPSGQEAPRQPEPNFWSQFPKTPHVVVNPGLPQGDFVVDESGRPTGPGQGSIVMPPPQLPSDWVAPLPGPSPTPDLKQYMDWLPSGPSAYQRDSPDFF